MGSVKAMSVKVGVWVVPVLLVLSLSLFSGCTLLLLGAGGMGGYMIRKGEEGNGKKKQSFVVDRAYAALNDGRRGDSL